MLQSVDVGRRWLAGYRGIAPDALLDELVALAATLCGLRILHLNATPCGGGVSELLRSAVPPRESSRCRSLWSSPGSARFHRRNAQAITPSRP